MAKQELAVRPANPQFRHRVQTRHHHRHPAVGGGRRSGEVAQGGIHHPLVLRAVAPLGGAGEVLGKLGEKGADAEAINLLEAQGDAERRQPAVALEVDELPELVVPVRAGEPFHEVFARQVVGAHREELAVDGDEVAGLELAAAGGHNRLEESVPERAVGAAHALVQPPLVKGGQPLEEPALGEEIWRVDVSEDEVHQPPQLVVLLKLHVVGGLMAGDVGDAIGAEVEEVEELEVHLTGDHHLGGKSQEGRLDIGVVEVGRRQEDDQPGSRLARERQRAKVRDAALEAARHPERLGPPHLRVVELERGRLELAHVLVSKGGGDGGREAGTEGGAAGGQHGQRQAP